MYVSKLIKYITSIIGYQRFPDSYIFVIYKLPQNDFDYRALLGPNELDFIYLHIKKIRGIIYNIHVLKSHKIFNRISGIAGSIVSRVLIGYHRFPDSIIFVIYKLIL